MPRLESRHSTAMDYHGSSVFQRRKCLQLVLQLYSFLVHTVVTSGCLGTAVVLPRIVRPGRPAWLRQCEVC